MLVYEAVLEDRPIAIVSVRLRKARVSLKHAVDGLGLRPPGATPWRVRVRYAIGSGAILTHKGLLWAQHPAPYGVGGWQLTGFSLRLTFVPLRTTKAVPDPVPDPPRLAPQGATFRIPIRVPAWGIQQVVGARHSIFVRAVLQGGRLSLIGRLRLDLGDFRLRVPFCCQVLGSVAWEPPCAVHGALTGLSLTLRDGYIEGTATVGLWAAPAATAHWHPYGPPVHLRQLTGQIAWVRATPVGDESAIVQGEAEVDLYWVANDAVSRCTTRRAPFSLPVELPGYDPRWDRLEVAAQVVASQMSLAAFATEAHLQVQVSVVAMRPYFVPYGGAHVRMEYVAAYCTGHSELQFPLLMHPPEASLLPTGVPQVTEPWERLDLGDSDPSAVAGEILIRAPGPVAAITRCSPQGLILVCEGLGPHFSAAALPEGFVAWPVERSGAWYLQVSALGDGARE